MDIDWFPHLVEAVVGYSNVATLGTIRATSGNMKKVADKHLLERQGRLVLDMCEGARGADGERSPQPVLALYGVGIAPLRLDALQDILGNEKELCTEPITDRLRHCSIVDLQTEIQEQDADEVLDTLTSQLVVLAVRGCTSVMPRSLRDFDVGLIIVLGNTVSDTEEEQTPYLVEVDDGAKVVMNVRKSSALPGCLTNDTADCDFVLDVSESTNGVWSIEKLVEAVSPLLSAQSNRTATMTIVGLEKLWSKLRRSGYGKRLLRRSGSELKTMFLTQVKAHNPQEYRYRKDRLKVYTIKEYCGVVGEEWLHYKDPRYRFKHLW
jgi:hypothetical protein